EVKSQVQMTLDLGLDRIWIGIRRIDNDRVEDALVGDDERHRWPRWTAHHDVDADVEMTGREERVGPGEAPGLLKLAQSLVDNEPLVDRVHPVPLTLAARPDEAAAGHDVGG